MGFLGTFRLKELGGFPEREVAVKQSVREIESEVNICYTFRKTTWQFRTAVSTNIFFSNYFPFTDQDEEENRSCTRQNMRVVGNVCRRNASLTLSAPGGVGWGRSAPHSATVYTYQKSMGRNSFVYSSPGRKAFRLVRGSISLSEMHTLTNGAKVVSKRRNVRKKSFISKTFVSGTKWSP